MQSAGKVDHNGACQFHHNIKGHELISVQKAEESAKVTAPVVHVRKKGDRQYKTCCGCKGCQARIQKEFGDDAERRGP